MNPTKRLNELEEEVMNITTRAQQLETERDSLLRLQECWAAAHYWEVSSMRADFSTVEEVVVECQICRCRVLLQGKKDILFGHQGIPLKSIMEEEE